jgi:hypothetical protein
MIYLLVDQKSGDINRNSLIIVTSIERDKSNYQWIIAIFDRLLKFGIEPIKNFIFYIYF